MLMVAGCGDGRKVPENSLAFADVVYVEDEYPVTWELGERLRGKGFAADSEQ